MRNKLVLDAYDSVIALCKRHLKSINTPRAGASKESQAALSGKRTVYLQMVNFCNSKKAAMKKGEEK